MSDIFDQKKRSFIMSQIRGKNTSCERVAFAYLRKNKIYFQKHYKRAAGSPDIALPRKKKAVFIDGDFWHGHDFEKREAKLKPFWKAKLLRNVERDKSIDHSLHEAGWEILRVWESEIKTKRTRDETLARIAEFLRADKVKDSKYTGRPY